MQVAKLIKQDWPIVVYYNKNFGSKLLLKHFITKVLEYEAEGLNLYVLLCVP